MIYNIVHLYNVNRCIVVVENNKSSVEYKIQICVYNYFSHMNIEYGFGANNYDRQTRTKQFSGLLRAQPNSTALFFLVCINQTVQLPRTGLRLYGSPPSFLLVFSPPRVRSLSWHDWATAAVRQLLRSRRAPSPATITC